MEESAQSQRPASASQILRRFSHDWHRDTIRLRDIVDALGERAYGLLLLIFAIPNAIPNPVPGITAILGLPLVLIAGQLVIGRPHPWFPRALGERAIKTEDFNRTLSKIEPWLQRIERLLRPRLTRIFTPFGERALGGVAFLMALILTLPIPLANLLPALSICFIALALIEFDGLMAVIGGLAAVLSVVIASSVVYGFVKIGLFLLRHAFH